MDTNKTSTDVEQTKDEFISLISHELRSPLSAIKGLVSMLLHGDYGDVSDRMRAPLTNVYTSAVRQIRLINELLNISRLKEGRIRYTVSSFLPQTIVQQVLATYEPQVRLKRITLTSDPGEQVMLQADDLWLKEILDHLISNAVTFTEKGSVHISYRYDAEQVALVVTDTGVGINPQQQERLFGKFEQMITKEHGKGIGSGLGLFISREIAKKMGGDVVLLQSIPGQGSTFAVTLPRVGTTRAQQAQQNLEKLNEIALNKKVGNTG